MPDRSFELDRKKTMELCSGRISEITDYKKAFCGDPRRKTRRSDHEFADLDRTLADLVALSSEERRKVGCSKPSDPGSIRKFCLSAGGQDG